MTSFAFDRAAKKNIPIAKRLKASHPIDCSKDPDAGCSDCGGEVHRSCIVAEIQDTFFKCCRRTANVQFTCGVYTATPLSDKSGSLFPIFRAAEDDGHHIMRFDQT